MTVILGGGISGLSAAFYACESRLGKLILFEGSDRLGGWIRSTESSSGGTIFEMGPRTVRPKGDSGQNTLRLIEKLHLTEKIISIPSNHPSARNRMIYANNRLHLLPNSIGSLFKKLEPFERPLIKNFWRDLKAPKAVSDDESMYSFVERRLGKDIADNLISPMICGICAGDAKKISVNFLMSGLFEAEQKHGSIVKGLMFRRMEQLFGQKSKDEKSIDKRENIESRLVNLAVREKWSVWGLKGGLEQLPQKLAEILKLKGADVRLNESCEKITFLPDKIQMNFNDKTIECSRLISSLSAKNLAPLLERQHPQLARELSAIPTVTVGLVNLEFTGKCLPIEAFGFLVPPREKLPILGVIFDSCIFSNASSTVLTVMMGGAWFNEYFGTSPSNQDLLKVALEQVGKILGIKEPPIAHNVAILRDCIPQHVVGHKKRLKRIQDYIASHDLPLALCGSSYQGVGLNDVILSAKQAVCDISLRVHRTNDH